MAIQSFADAHQQLYAGQKNQSSVVSPPTGSVSSFQQAHTQLITASKAKPTQAPVKTAAPVIPQHVKLNSPIDSLKNNIFNGLKQVGQAAIDIAPKIPEAHFADKMNFFTPLGFAANIAQGFINTPAEALKGNADQAEHIKKKNSTPQQIAADAAAAVQLPLLFLTPEASAAKEGAKIGVKEALASLGKTSVIGGAFGALGGLQSGKNITNANDYVKNLLKNVAIGAGSGAAIHSTVEGAKVVLPLAKGLPAKVGAIFVKKANTDNPVIDHIQMDAKTAQSAVINKPELEKSTAGKAILKESVIAQQTGEHVGVTPTEDGAYVLPGGEKVDVSLVQPINPDKTTPYDTPEVIKARAEQNKISDTSLINTPERDQFREKVATNLYDNGGYAHAERRPTTEVKSEKRVDIVTGLPASGKNTMFSDPLVKEHGSILVDSDEAKHQIPESNGGTYNGAIHNESIDIHGRVLDKALTKGNNVVIPMVGRTADRVTSLAETLKEAGYDVHLHHSEIKPETSIKRGLTRFKESGKFVDPAYIMHEVGLRPNENYDKIKTNKAFTTYEKYSNEVPQGEKPRLIEKGSNVEQRSGRSSDQHINPGSEKTQKTANSTTVKSAEKNIVYHGSTGGGVKKWGREVAYFAKDKKVASEFAKIDKNGQIVKNPLVIKKELPEGKTKDISNVIKEKTFFTSGDEIVMNAASSDKLVLEEAAKARKEGFDYLSFKNPKGEEYIVSINPHKLNEKATATPLSKVEKTAQTGNSTNQLPVGTGKIRESSAYKRLVQHLEKEDPEAAKALGEGKVTYNRANIQDQAEKAMKLLEKDPQKAYDVAKGYENPPEGMLQRPVVLALADRAREEKNWKLFADLESSGSLNQTRHGQESSMDRGRFNDNSTHTYIKQLLDARLTALGKNKITEGIDTAKKALGQATSSAKANAVAKIDRAAQQLQKELRKQQVKIQSAQSILDALTCK